MARVELIGIPFDGYGRPGNQASASAALRTAGLAGAFSGHDVVDTGDLELPANDPSRGRATGLMNEAALEAMVDAVERRTGEALAAGRFPVLFGGDCATLLGTVAAHPGGLLFVDGHEDTMPLDVSEDGEAANCEIGLLLGVTGHLLEGPLAARVGVLSTGRLAMLGQRDRQWRRQFNVGSLRDLGVWLRSETGVRDDAATAATDALDHLRSSVERWWLHVDLDVLDPAEFPAQGISDAPDEPGGLSLAQLHELVGTAVRSGGCLGASLAIYDPEQDPDGSGARDVVRLAVTIAEAL